MSADKCRGGRGVESGDEGEEQSGEKRERGHG
jgi:hypothetical protein